MKITDDFLVEAIQSKNQQKQNWALYQFYNDFSLKSSIIKYVKHTGGSEEDGQEVFQETMWLFARNIMQGRYNGNSTLTTYFIAIAKWHWVTYRRKYKNLSEVPLPQHIDLVVESVDMQLFDKEKKEWLDKAIQQLGTRCQELLNLYKLDYSMKEIQELLGFSSTNMAKKAAYRCRQQLRKVFLKNPALLKALNINIKDV